MLALQPQAVIVAPLSKLELFHKSLLSCRHCYYCSGDGLPLHLLFTLINLFQVAVTVGTWLACRKYHPTFGVVGTGLRHGTVDEQMWWLNQGWEWWPTIAWQFLWTWILAPIMIIRAWHIEDTLGWRTQTIGCCIAG